jgi:hypothetical protein
MLKFLPSWTEKRIHLGGEEHPDSDIARWQVRKISPGDHPALKKISLSDRDTK